MDKYLHRVCNCLCVHQSSEGWRRRLGRLLSGALSVKWTELIRLMKDNNIMWVISISRSHCAWGVICLRVTRILHNTSAYWPSLWPSRLACTGRIHAMAEAGVVRSPLVPQSTATAANSHDPFNVPNDLKSRFQPRYECTGYQKVIVLL